MRGWTLALVTTFGALALAPACSIFNGGSSESESTISCSPGQYSTCRCKGGGSGTRLCKDDGKSFEACANKAGGECVEEEDQGPGDVVDPPDDKEDGGPGEEEGPPVNSCPGQATAVGADRDIVIEGDTTDAKDKARGKPGTACAVGAGGPDHIYHLVPSATGTITYKVQGTAPLNPTVYVRTTCDDEATQSSCAETTGVGAVEQQNVKVVTGRDYYLVVDGASGSAGKYKVTLRLAAGGFCGDGTVGTNEVCDDGNNVDGDGCGAGCNNVNGNPTSANSCPGHPVHVWPGRTVTGTGSNSTTANTFKRTSSACSVSGSDVNVSNDHVYAVTPHASGSLIVKVTPVNVAMNPQLVARRTCTDPATQGAGMCANDVGPSNPGDGSETMTFSVTNGTPVYVAVDGGAVAAAKGDYNISFRIQ